MIREGSLVAASEDVTCLERLKGMVSKIFPEHCDNLDASVVRTMGSGSDEGVVDELCTGSLKMAGEVFSISGHYESDAACLEAVASSALQFLEIFVKRREDLLEYYRDSPFNSTIKEYFDQIYRLSNDVSPPRDNAMSMKTPPEASKKSIIEYVDPRAVAVQPSLMPNDTKNHSFVSQLNDYLQKLYGSSGLPQFKEFRGTNNSFGASISIGRQQFELPAQFRTISQAKEEVAKQALSALRIISIEQINEIAVQKEAIQKSREYTTKFNALKGRLKIGNLSTDFIKNGPNAFMVSTELFGRSFTTRTHRTKKDAMEDLYEQLFKHIEQMPEYGGRGLPKEPIVSDGMLASPSLMPSVMPPHAPVPMPPFCTPMMYPPLHHMMMPYPMHAHSRQSSTGFPHSSASSSVPLPQSSVTLPFQAPMMAHPPNPMASHPPNQMIYPHMMMPTPYFPGYQTYFAAPHPGLSSAPMQGQSYSPAQSAAALTGYYDAAHYPPQQPLPKQPYAHYPRGYSPYLPQGPNCVTYEDAVNKGPQGDNQNGN